MRKGYFILAMLFIGVGSTAQEKKQFVLKNEVELKHYLGTGYQRMPINEQEIRMADSLAAAFMLKAHKGDYIVGIMEYYYNYNRQYAAFKSSSPEKIVFINAFLRYDKELSSGQLEDILYDTRGGGGSYFKIKVNLDKKECFDLRINAPK